MVGVIFIRKSLYNCMMFYYCLLYLLSVLSCYRRPPGDVISHMKSLDADTMKKAIEELEKEVNEMQRKNETLKKKIIESRSKICILNDNLNRHLNDAPIIIERFKKLYDQLVTGFEIIASDYEMMV